MTGSKNGSAGRRARRPSTRFANGDHPFHPHRFATRWEPLSSGPLVLVTPAAYKSMLLYVNIASKEVGWLGTVSERGDGTFLIEEVFLLEQEVTNSQTELSTAGQDQLVCELLENGAEGMRKANNLRFWGHSHVRGRTFPSSTDDNTMKRFGEEGYPFFIRGIFNKLGEARFTIYLYRQGVKIWDAPWAVLNPVNGRRLVPPQPLASADGAPAVKLPPVLTPNRNLRRQILREFRAKVTDIEPERAAERASERSN